MNGRCCSTLFSGRGKELEVVPYDRAKTIMCLLRLHILCT